MSKNPCFPTQGELVQFTFNVFGLMPRKYDPSDEFDEKSKKSFQRLLQRLGDEEGLLLNNFEKALDTFHQLLASQIADQEVCEVVTGALRDLYRSYNDMITEEGTFLAKHLSVLYFVFSQAMVTLIESAYFRSLQHRLFCHYGLVPIEPDWFLPEIQDDSEITWPLARVMRWIYHQASSSQTQFHYPGKTPESDNLIYERNLENARNWVRGESLPSLPGLLSNFYQSIRGREDEIIDDPDLAESIPLLLLVARVSNAVCWEIHEAYGLEIITQLTNDCSDLVRSLKPEATEFKSEIMNAKGTEDLSEIDALTWDNAYAQYMSFFYFKKQEASETLKRLRAASPANPFKPPVIHALTEKLGRYPVISQLYPITQSKRWNVTEAFRQLLLRGLDLKNNPATKTSDSEEFKQDLRSHDLEDQLSWLASWIDAAIAYRSEDYSAAMDLFEQAFEQAKYRAGKAQYKLVNQYLEVCAKNDQKRRFKKGVEWARYLGIPIRWLRDKEPTEENLDFVFYIFSKATYPQL